MLLQKKETKFNADNTLMLETYEAKGYEIGIVTNIETKEKDLTFWNGNDIADIYYNKYEKEHFRIQTTSVGSLNVDAMKDFIEKYNNAIEVVEELKRMGF